MVERLFLAVPQGCLQFVIVVFPDHTHLLFWKKESQVFCRLMSFLGLSLLSGFGVDGTLHNIVIWRVI